MDWDWDWDGIGMDLRVGGGIEHLTVLIIQEIRLVICKKIIIIRKIFRPPRASIADAEISSEDVHALVHTPLLEPGKCWGKSHLPRAGYKL